MNFEKEINPMKRSAIYKLAQIAVLDSNRLAPDVKLAVLRELMDKEDVAAFCEKEEGENGSE